MCNSVRKIEERRTELKKKENTFKRKRHKKGIRQSIWVRSKFVYKCFV